MTAIDCEHRHFALFDRTSVVRIQLIYTDAASMRVLRSILCMTKTCLAPRTNPQPSTLSAPPERVGDGRIESEGAVGALAAAAYEHVVVCV